MPCLSHLTIQQLDMDCCPPRELLLYPRLRHLDLSFVFLQTLPDFFTGLTQLEHLVLFGHSFDFCFPHPVLALSQLQTLDMSSPAVMDLPENLVNCATWPNLTSLDLGLTGDKVYSLDLQMVLLLLGNAIKESGSKVHLIVDQIYIRCKTHTVNSCTYHSQAYKCTCTWWLRLYTASRRVDMYMGLHTLLLQPCVDPGCIYSSPELGTQVHSRLRT